MSCLIAGFLSTLLSHGLLPQGLSESLVGDAWYASSTCEVDVGSGESSSSSSSSGTSRGGSSQPASPPPMEPVSSERDRLYNGF